MKSSRRVFWKKVISGALMLGMLMVPGTRAQAATEVWDTVGSAGSGCTKVVVSGSYVTEAQKALDRINAIRLEACKQGVTDPRNTNRKLTVDDYVPLKWSADMEYIARVRAAEASLVVSHTRPNGEKFYTVTSNGVAPNGEVLAWNAKKTMLSGIEQWYSEKSDWVKKTDNVTGHYEAMINPANKSVGLSCFVNKNGCYLSTISGEFSTKASTKTTMSDAASDIDVIIEIKKTALDSTVSLVRTYSTNSSTTYKVGDKMDFAIGMKSTLEGWKATVFDPGKLTWKSSDTSVATVTSEGRVTVVGIGSSTISATSTTGRSASIKVTALGTQTINVASSFTKTYAQGGTFSLKATAKGTLSYSSSNTSVAAVSSKGVVTIKGCGKATITVKAAKTSSYAPASKKVAITIKPKQITMSKVTSPKTKTILAKWKMNGTVSGYAVQCAQTKDFTGSTLVKKLVSGNSNVQATLTNLTKGKTYYVRVRGYKKTSSGSVYGAWSTPVSVKVK